MSSPALRIFAPVFGNSLRVILFPDKVVSSIGITESAPSGIFPPVIILIASPFLRLDFDILPASTVLVILNILLLSFGFDLYAKPSIAELS